MILLIFLTFFLFGEELSSWSSELIARHYCRLNLTQFDDIVEVHKHVYSYHIL